MKILSVTYNESTDNTQVNITESFNNSDWLTKADVLKDAIIILQKQYSDFMSIKNWDEREKHRFKKQTKRFEG